MSVRKIGVRSSGWPPWPSRASRSPRCLPHKQSTVRPSATPNLGVDVIGVGSDTTQWAMDALANTYQTAVPTGPRLITYDACIGNTQAGAQGLGSNPDGSGFPCGADNTGTKAGVPRPESDLTWQRGRHRPPSRGFGVSANAPAHAQRPALQRRRLRAILGPDEHRGPQRRSDPAAVRGGQVRLCGEPDRPCAGGVDRAADPQDLQRHLHQLEPGRRPERPDPPLPARSRLGHPEQLAGVPRGARRRHRGSRAATTTRPRTRPRSRSGRVRGTPSPTPTGTPARSTSRSTTLRSSSPTPTPFSSSPTGALRWPTRTRPTSASRAVGPRTARSTTSCAARRSRVLAMRRATPPRSSTETPRPTLVGSSRASSATRAGSARLTLRRATSTASASGP